MNSRNDPSAKDVYDAICTLSAELSVTPNYQMIAEMLACSRMHVSNMMVVLEELQVITRIDRYRYSVIDSEWNPPDVSKI